ncbi:aspartate aminotransferase family protein [Nostoc sp. FACHB-110]|uniref:aspartate aminotransferase family protein n=1 Tax=Nostoc sp. FACHB-110 TaxID=2692834 RepID=UPI0016894D11|nr:aminotransferase class III-fold pyridoxal phosphate-dependent enzyme [Nostoc sp. FACHB-110]MBD2435866.1 aminotransferase class III-fold pyridoxal phosphate-dependent enzyme [Nostoc sp. FACHB-110]
MDTTQTKNHPTAATTHQAVEIEFNPRQQQHLETLITRYTQRTKTSKQLAQKYRHVFANNRGAVGFNLLLKEMFYPILTERSLGSRMWDVDGNEYIDLTGGYGIHLCGYNPPFIKKAIAQQLEHGIQSGPQAALAGEVAELISELTGMERVAFCSVGTEAIMLALRTARAATNRHKIALFSGSYHGIFDGTLVKAQTSDSNHPTGIPEYPGVTPNTAEDVLVLEYGSPESLEIIKIYQQELAAVLVEPVQQHRLGFQPTVFIHQLRQLTQTLGIALIFDEMNTGFRIHPGGAQAWFGVTADIATYGKIVGGGMPLAAVAGKAIYLDTIDGGMWNYGDMSSPDVPTTWSGTSYCRHSFSLAAARALLQYLKVQGSTLQDKLNQTTSQFIDRMNIYFDKENLPIQLSNFGSFFNVNLLETSEFLQDPTFFIGLQLIFKHMISRGVLMPKGDGFFSQAHTPQDIDFIVQTVKDSVNALREGGFLNT